MHGIVGPRNVLQAMSVEWWTPREFVDRARRAMGGIDLDPASCEQANRHVRAKRFFDQRVDGLTQHWHGRVWLNPPYGKDAKRFVERLLSEFRLGHVQQAIALLNCNSIETRWFEPLRNYPLCFPRGRIHFMSPNYEVTSSTHGSVFVYLGRRERAFAKEFNQIGDVFKRWAHDRRSST